MRKYRKPINPIRAVRDGLFILILLVSVSLLAYGISSAVYKLDQHAMYAILAGTFGTVGVAALAKHIVK